LRSVAEVRGYHIEGSDGAIGHVDDFVVDDESWEVRYLVVDTSNWWFGNKVLVAPHWASRISWGERKVYVDVSRQAIKDSPEWNPTATIDRAYEEHLYDHHGRTPYWAIDHGRVGAQLAQHADGEAK
jgi:sporulation protein YlmC with PRC-barrel domain